MLEFFYVYAATPLTCLDNVLMNLVLK